MMSKLGWYFETVEGWTTLLKDKEPYLDWDSRGPDDPPSDDQKAELLGLLNGHKTMLAALYKYGNHRPWCIRNPKLVNGEYVCKCGFDAAITVMKGGAS